MWPLGIIYAAALIVIIGLIQYWVYKWRNPKCNGTLPPGSMGLPIIGETLQFFTQNNSIDTHPFIKNRTMKYGRIFKTCLAGRPVVVSSDPEFNYYIFQQEGKLVEIWYLDSFAKLIDARGLGRDGERAPITSIGHIHRCMRNMVLSQIGKEALRERLLPGIEEISQKTLLAWSSQDSLDVKKETCTVLFDFLAKHLYGFESENSPSLSARFSYIIQGFLSFPLNIPGTVYYKCLKNQKMGLRLMKDLINERRAAPKGQRGDFIDDMLNMMKTESFLSEDFAVVAMFVLLFASFEAISSTLTLAIVFLTEHPAIVKELEREHAKILQNREHKERGVTWNEYKSMNFTMQVVNEALRMGSVSPGILRRAIKDIQVNGYTIPKGWTILVVPSALQLDPHAFKDPLSFNPRRWKDLPRKAVAKNFIGFGGGTRMCAGAEFTKAFIAIFLHVLVSNYRWEKVRGGEISRSPILGFGDGFYIKIQKKEASNGR